VTGLATLLKAQDNSRSAETIATIIKNTADDLVGDPSEDTLGFDRYYGFGRINAERALCGTNDVTTSYIDLPDLLFFPNPSHGCVSAHIEGLSVKYADVAVYDMHGRQ
jgi:thermitase